MWRTRLFALVLAGLLVACSSPADPTAQPEPPVADAAPTIDPEAGVGDKDAGTGDDEDRGSGKGRSEGSAEGPSSEGSDEAGTDGGESSDSGEPSSDDGAEDAAHAAYPAGGTYVYSQSGSEAFCDPAGGCERHKLPPTQKIGTSYGQRTETEAMVVTEVRSSNGRYVRTTTHFTPGAAFVTEVYYRLEYEGLSLSEQYNPEPPVPQLRFPLRAGREWKASWKDDTSGDYHARVTGIDSVKAGGAEVDAYRIETLTNFRGELNGKASVVVWFDPETRAIVRTNGALNLSASYGSYNTTFETALKSAPGY